MNLVLENNDLEWKNKLGLLTPEVREMFFKYSGALIRLGVELRERDVKLAGGVNLANQKKTPNP